MEKIYTFGGDTFFNRPLGKMKKEICYDNIQNDLRELLLSG
jgi:hypothetical protein